MNKVGKHKLTVAIYNGVIPSTTFIENLIHMVAQTHQVLLFGTIKGHADYESPNIKVINTPMELWKNIPLTLWRTLILFFKAPKLAFIAINESSKYNGLYVRWMRFSRFVPVLLYRPDIFHLQWTSKINRWAFLKDAYKCKFVVSLLGTQLTISPMVHLKMANRYRKYFPLVDKFHTVCEDLSEKAKSYGAAHDKIHKIHTVLNPAIFQQELKTWKPGEGLKLVSVGRHHWVKGYRYGIEAMAILRDKGMDVSYTIIAPDAPTEEILYLVKQLNLENSICFKKGMPQDQLFEHLMLYDVFLLPSVSEGMANVVLEAMLLGLPVVSSNCGGMREVVKHEETGWLVPVRNAKSIARQVQLISTESPSVLNNVTKKASDFIRLNFNSESISNQMKYLYEVW